MRKIEIRNTNSVNFKDTIANNLFGKIDATDNTTIIDNKAELGSFGNIDSNNILTHSSKTNKGSFGHIDANNLILNDNTTIDGSITSDIKKNNNK